MTVNVVLPVLLRVSVAVAVVPLVTFPKARLPLKPMILVGVLPPETANLKMTPEFTLPVDVSPYIVEPINRAQSID